MTDRTKALDELIAGDAENDVLKPCPHCRSENIQVKQDCWQRSWWRVECTHCHANGPQTAKQAEAIAAWNQRATTDDVALKPCRECDCTGVAETIGGYDRPCDACSGMGEIRTRAAWNQRATTVERPESEPVAWLYRGSMLPDEGRLRFSRPRVILEDWTETPLYTHPTDAKIKALVGGTFSLGDRVTKTKGSSWTGRVVGFYSTELTPEGYAVESENEPGSVQIYPRSALAAFEGDV